MTKYFAREPIAKLEDLRDDCIAVVRNSRLTFNQIRERGGPSPQTLSKWLYRETRFPQLATIRAALLACDHDFSITPQAEVTRISGPGIRMPKVKPSQLAKPYRRKGRG